MARSTPEPESGAAVLQREILRWNQQINLVSRVRTRERVSRLIHQCATGWELVAAALAGDDWLPGATYFDLGSGSGLPGLVWADSRQRLGHAGPSVLVEPRDKRAWFLRRTARAMGLDRVTVWPVRWGEQVEELHAPDALVSLKALRLEDHEVLANFPRPGGGAGETCPRLVAIVRFLDPVRRSREELEAMYAVADRPDDLGWRRTGIETLGDGDPWLLVTRYRSD